MTKSEWLEQATAGALDDAREAAQAEGREPTAEEFATAINSIGEPPKRQRRAKREPKDKRAQYFWLWLGHGDYWLEHIHKAPGGFDPVHLASTLSDKDFCPLATPEDCHQAIAKARARIVLIESVLAERDRQSPADPHKTLKETHAAAKPIFVKPSNNN
jgi:hypothetical protein